MSRALIALVIVGAMCGHAQAQSMPLDVEERTAAGWTFTPGVSFGGAWDSGINTSSNPFVENVFQRWVGLVNPWADVNFKGQRGHFNAGYSGSFEKYWSSDMLWNQHSRVGGGRTITRRLSVSGDLGYSAAPTTDRLEIVQGAIPYIDVDASWLTMGGGLAYQVGRRTNLDLSYHFQRVTIDRPFGAISFGTLRDGHSHSPSLGLMHAVTERLSIGGRGELRREYIDSPEETFDIDAPSESFDVGSATGEFSYRLSPVTIINGGGGVSQLTVVLTGVSTVAPTYHGGIDHQARHFRLNASYSHAFEQLFGFGTLGSTNTFYGSVTIPLADRLYYLKGTVAYSRSEGVEEIGTAFDFDSLWLNATVGRQLSQRIRAEGFVSVANQRQQLGFWPGANRHRFGVQIVTSKPMRMQ